MEKEAEEQEAIYYIWGGERIEWRLLFYNKEEEEQIATYYNGGERRIRGSVLLSRTRKSRSIYYKKEVLDEEEQEVTYYFGGKGIGSYLLHWRRRKNNRLYITLKDEEEQAVAHYTEGGRRED